MKTVVYINNDQIQIAHSKGKFVKSKIIDLEVGTVLNGAIINSEVVIEELKNLKKELKNVTVLISSSSIQTKKVNLPVVPKKHFNNIVKGEFELNAADTYLFSGSILSKQKKMTEVLCVAIQKELIKNYVDVFRKAGVPISRIDALSSCIVKYAYNKKILKEGTYVMNVLSGHNMMSVLFEQGQYKIINRNRMLSDIGTPEFVQEVYEKLSQMIQFNITSEFVIQRSYYLGLTEDDLIELAELAEHDDIIVSEYSSSDMLSEGSCACFGLAETKEDVNFYTEYKNATKGNNDTALGVKCMALALSLSAIIGLWWLSIYNENTRIQKEIDSLNAYLTSSTVVESLALIDALQEEQASLEAVLYEFDVINDTVNRGRHLSPDILRTINSDSAITLINVAFDMKTITYTINANSANMTLSGNYAEMLRNSGYFEEVYYQVDNFNNEKSTFAIVAEAKEMEFIDEEEEISE